jgi:hypothetical protein
MRFLLMIGASAFDQRNGARQYCAVAGADLSGEGGNVRGGRHRGHVILGGAGQHGAQAEALTLLIDFQRLFQKPKRADWAG